MNKLINIIKALSDEIRLRIINLLSFKEELCVCEIVDTLLLPQSTVSRHLTILKNAGIVEDRKCGQWAFYKLVIGKEDGSFIKTLIEKEFKVYSIFEKDIEILKNRLKQGKKCFNQLQNKE